MRLVTYVGDGNGGAWSNRVSASVDTGFRGVRSPMRSGPQGFAPAAVETVGSPRVGDLTNPVAVG